MRKTSPAFPFAYVILRFIYRRCIGTEIYTYIYRSRINMPRYPDGISRRRGNIDLHYTTERADLSRWELKPHGLLEFSLTAAISDRDPGIPCTPRCSPAKDEVDEVEPTKARRTREGATSRIFLLSSCRAASRKSFVQLRENATHCVQL